ncbi:MAG: RNA methyltransferase [Coriobacteriia bacterium]|nr:RNA methyltransferase [Coriobacteriia bacterium]
MENMEIITSSGNDFFKQVKSYSVSKYRKRDDILLVEGQRIYDEALVRLTPVYTIVSESYLGKHDAAVLEGLPNLRVLTDSLFNSLSELKTSQGILGVFKVPTFDDVDVTSLNRLVVLEGVQDPKNVGAIIRSAHCLGYQAVFLGDGCASPFSPKVIRSSMGSSIYLPTFADDTLAQLRQLKDSGFFLIGTDLSGSEDVLQDMDALCKIAIVIGAEGRGLSSGVLELCDYRFKVSICESAESLNVSVASGIIMHIFNADR